MNNVQENQTQFRQLVLKDLSLLTGWIPSRLYWRGAEPVVDWCYLGSTRFTHPFFDQTTQTCFHHPFNLRFRRQTPIDTLIQWQAVQPGLAPTGFIFHMSRCGSTLISQMLAALPQNIVISEAEPIDAILRAHLRNHDVTDDQRLTWLQAAISSLGQQRQAQEKYFFIKFDSWHVSFLPLIQRAFPDVPWVFIYRDPIEVIVSHCRQRGSQMVPGVLEPELFGFDPAMINQVSLDEYCARVLAGICQAVLQFHQNSRRLLINYQQLPEVVFSALLGFFDLVYAQEDLDRMGHVTQFYSKSPSLFFEADTTAKKQEATDLIQQLAEQWVKPLYEQLETIRQAQPYAEEKISHTIQTCGHEGRPFDEFLYTSI